MERFDRARYDNSPEQVAIRRRNHFRSALIERYDNFHDAELDRTRRLALLIKATMGRQNFADVGAMDPPSAAFPTITATTETVLVPTIATQIAPWEPKASKVWELTVAGTCTTGTAGTLTLTPRFGLTIGGVALGGSPAQNYVPSITLAPFICKYWLEFYSIQVANASATSTCVGYGQFAANGAAATAASETSVYCGSTGPVSVDVSAASALWMGVTFSVAPSVIPRFCIWQPLN